jgi:tRNA pseudouridine38-40 synthase
MLVFRVAANRFLRGMVRSIVGTLVDVGRGRTSPDRFHSILESLDRGEAGATSPAHGLYLTDVIYQLD